MLRPITVLALALLTILATVVSAETTDSVRSAMVICTTKKLSDPWALIAQGELIGTRSANRTDYRLKAAGQTFSYMATSNPDGTTSFSPPVSLIRTLIEWSPRHQSPTIPRGPIVVPLNLVPESELPTYGISINLDGSIREYALSPTDTTILIAMVGSTCPSPGEEGPNSAPHRDGREASHVDQPSSSAPARGRER
jgi:hypothetical protein